MSRRTFTDGSVEYWIDHCECHKGTQTHPPIVISPYPKEEIKELPKEKVVLRRMGDTWYKIN